jgi:hypothetical protein
MKAQSVKPWKVDWIEDLIRFDQTSLVLIQRRGTIVTSLIGRARAYDHPAYENTRIMPLPSEGHAATVCKYVHKQASTVDEMAAIMA